MSLAVFIRTKSERIEARTLQQEPRCDECGRYGTPDNPLTIVSDDTGEFPLCELCLNEYSHLVCPCPTPKASQIGHLYP